MKLTAIVSNILSFSCDCNSVTSSGSKRHSACTALSFRDKKGTRDCGQLELGVFLEYEENHRYCIQHDQSCGASKCVEELGRPRLPGNKMTIGEEEGYRNSCLGMVNREQIVTVCSRTKIKGIK